MSKELANVSKEVSYTPEQIQLIKNTVAKGATDDELKLFMQVAKRTKLDPFTKQIHFVKRSAWNKETRRHEEIGSIQTGIDGYRAIAEQTGTLAGIDDAVYDLEDGNHPNKATVTVHRFVQGHKVAFTATARWNEYAPTFKDRNGQLQLSPMWRKMPYLMLAKCAEALALRKAFPNDLSGLYTNEEMQQARSEEPQPEQVEVERVSAPKPDPVLVLKDSIHRKLKALRPDVNATNIHQVVFTLTGLQLSEENYQDINARLQLRIEERKNT